MSLRLVQRHNTQLDLWGTLNTSGTEKFGGLDEHPLRTTWTIKSKSVAGRSEPFEYLSEVFEQLPAATTLEAIEALLPWNLKPILDARKRPQAVPQLICSSLCHLPP